MLSNRYLAAGQMFASSIYKEYTTLVQLNVSADQFRGHLLHLGHMLETFPNFEIALIPNPLGPNFEGMCMWVKESSIFVAGNIVESTRASHPVLTCEASIVNAFYQQQDNLWQSIPRLFRSKEWIINKLNEIASAKRII